MIDIFKHIWNSYKDNARNFEKGEHCIQRHLYEPLNLPGHSGFLNDVSVTLIDKAVPKDPTEQDNYWIHALKTKAPLGLNPIWDREGGQKGPPTIFSPAASAKVEIRPQIFMVFSFNSFATLV